MIINDDAKIENIINTIYLFLIINITIYMLQNIIKWYKTANTDLLLKYKNFIIDLLSSKQKDNYDEIILFVEYLTMKNIKNEELLNCIKSLKFLIENNIVNPNKCYYVKNNTILLIREFIIQIGHEFEEYENEIKDIIDFLFDHMDPKDIKYYNDEENIFFPAMYNALISDYYYEYLYDKIMATGAIDNYHITFKYSGKKTVNLYKSVIYCKKKYIEIALNAGDDINFKTSVSTCNTDYNNANLAQLLLLRYHNSKNEEETKKVIDTLLMLIDKGINKEHTNLYGRNLMDIVYDYDWCDFPVGDSNLYDVLINFGVSERSGKKIPVKTLKTYR